MQIGLQLYTIREVMQQDFAGTLEKVAALGYAGVEFAGYGGLTPDEMHALLNRLQLTAAGSHVAIEQLNDNLNEHIEMSLAIGNRYLICPWLAEERYNTLSALEHTAEQLTTAAEQLAQHDLQLVYHNHGFEFTTTLEGLTVYDRLLTMVPSTALAVELDVCWVQYAGLEPIEVMSRYQNRMPLLHFKDLQRIPDGEPLTVELGLGELKLVSIAQAARQMGVEWLIVEQDQCQRDPLESVAANIAWVKANLT
ncbi:sugar phosphate isomerase/epimerase family protein [Paenibacillus sp. 481]|uniref:sugar phosphate isomerase/epimerase family protein n=1 Tax=Paenibacillus sp. 481 TaxID=2835869 RepID=UPI001E368057|nr:sugar phosphate isomerase/epimerase [Paenibacillus sp. 481]UHA74412.1 sugar phosphate isomerase/epimerase [Paenibacillus sp. 481]